MAIIVQNGEVFQISDNIIEEPPPAGVIFDNLKSLAVQLASQQNISKSNFGSVQSLIQGANPTFNVFAVASHEQNAESLVGTGTASGRVNFTTTRFAYNTSSSNILSTGKTIADMSGGLNSSLPQLDGKKWMANAVFDGTTNGFLGILLWVFTNSVINSSGTVVGSQTVSTAATIFHPSSSFTTNFRQIYQAVISPTGGVSASNVTGSAGWVFSSGQVTSSTGYRITNYFSADDGIWAFVLGGRVNGDPGPTFKTTNGYGFGNQNSSDISSNLYWAGSSVNSTSYVGFIFTGDA